MRIIKPVLMKIPNGFMNDNVYFLRTSITLYKQRYNFSLARLVYHSLKSHIELYDESLVIIAKDGNGRNIKASNLVQASHSQKQQSIYDLNRKEPLVLDQETRKHVITQAKLANSKQVTQYNMQGKKIKTYPSIAIAAEKTGISHRHISNRARGTEFSAGGFIWRFGKDHEIDIQPMSDTIAERRKKQRGLWKKRNPIQNERTPRSHLPNH